MKTVAKRFDIWHKTTTGYLVMTTIELGLAFLLGTLAVDSGSLVQYALATVLAIGGLLNLVYLLQKLIGKKHGK